MKFVLRSLATASALLLMAVTGAAADWKPAGPITMLIGFAAGGGADTQARMIAEELEKRHGWTIIPEQATGGGGAKLSAKIKDMPNDGTVIGLAVTETYGYNMVANPKAGFTQADITPLTTTAGFQMGIVSLASKGWNDFGDVIAAAKGRVAVTCFSSNVARFQSIVRAAQASDRSVAVVGRAIKRAISAAQEVGYLRDLPDFVREEDIDLLPRDNLVIICTGTQGEPRAAMAKIAAGVHESVTLEQGDTVIYSSRQIPGNEPAIAKVQDALIRRRINLVTDDDAPVHVSGHPSRDEMVEMYGLVKPRIAIPVHGTARHLVAHAELAETCQVRQTLLPDNGTVIRLAGKGGDSEAEIIDNVKTGALTHEKGKIVEIQSDMMRARRRMLWNGVVTTSLVMNRSGALCAVPAVSQTGIGDEAAVADYIATASIAVEDALSGMTRNARRDDGSVEEIAGQALRRVARSMFGLRPIVHVHVMRLDDGDLQGVA